MFLTRRSLFSIASLTLGLAATSAWAASQTDEAALAALRALYEAQPQAAELGDRAAAILVFPKIVKAGLVVGAQTGDGVLLIGGKPAAHYNISAASYGLQAGVESFAYALFFMTESSLKYLRESGGWAVGSGPSVVVVDKSAARNFNTTTLTQDVYAFPFGFQGLMAGIGLEGSKISRISP
ncbi:YSC84-related protein [Rhodoblastus sp.]|uniref:lipid-binding SYLF domain-containing protein n=1 Tax=Rhodoblastus sp. TaxID=1962975 RepID=UPI0035B05177